MVVAIVDGVGDGSHDLPPLVRVVSLQELNAVFPLEVPVAVQVIRVSVELLVDDLSDLGRK